MLPKCVCCSNLIKPGQAFVGFPVIRLIEVGKSQMAGGELLAHVSCFQEKMKTIQLELAS